MSITSPRPSWSRTALAWPTVLGWLWALLLLCGSYQGWQLRAAGPDAADESETGGLAPVEAAPPGPLERLGRLVGQEPEPEVAPPRMVHCLIDGVGGFVRRSECLQRGGAIDEPSWARSEG